MNEFKQYRRIQKAELRNVTNEECRFFHSFNETKGFFMRYVFYGIGNDKKISISKKDRKKGSPKCGDKIARNPKDYKDQWLVSEAYFNDNFELITNQ